MRFALPILCSEYCCPRDIEYVAFEVGDAMANVGNISDIDT